MKLGEYMVLLRNLITELEHKNIEWEKLEVVYGVDDEGNGFQPVYFSPSVGDYKDYFFVDIHDEAWEELGYEINSVCLN